jgi:hypothetical protein
VSQEEARQDLSAVVRYLRDLLEGNIEEARTEIQHLTSDRLVAALTELAADLAWETQRLNAEVEGKVEEFDRLIVEANLFRPGVDVLENWWAFSLLVGRNISDRVADYYPWLRAAALGNWTEAQRVVEQSEKDSPAGD